MSFLYSTEGSVPAHPKAKYKHNEEGGRGRRLSVGGRGLPCAAMTKEEEGSLSSTTAYMSTATIGHGEAPAARGEGCNNRAGSATGKTMGPGRSEMHAREASSERLDVADGVLTNCERPSSCSLAGPRCLDAQIQGAL